MSLFLLFFFIEVFPKWISYLVENWLRYSRLKAKLKIRKSTVALRTYVDWLYWYTNEACEACPFPHPRELILVHRSAIQGQVVDEEETCPFVIATSLPTSPQHLTSRLPTAQLKCTAKETHDTPTNLSLIIAGASLASFVYNCIRLGFVQIPWLNVVMRWHVCAAS